MGWGAFLSSAAGPIAKRVLRALGVGVISYAGTALIVTQISDAVRGAMGGIGADVYDLVALGGFVDAVNIWLAALVTVGVLAVSSTLGRIAG